MPEQAEIADLLTLLIEDYEEQQYALPKSSPLAVLEARPSQLGSAVDLPSLWASTIG